jgi:hypothetical protein
LTDSWLSLILPVKIGRIIMCPEELVKILDKYLLGWAFGDIDRASKGEAKLGAFILSACFIDAMAGFYKGIDREEAKRRSGPRFKDFVGEYLKQYDPQRLWEDLRCGLVHSYAEGGSYEFTHSQPQLHFLKSSRGRTILNLEDFLENLMEAYNRLRKDILSKKQIFDRAQRRYELMGLMASAPV